MLNELYTPDSALTHLFHAGRQPDVWRTPVGYRVDRLSHCRQYGKHRQYECQRGIKTDKLCGCCTKLLRMLLCVCQSVRVSTVFVYCRPLCVLRRSAVLLVTGWWLERCVLWLTVLKSSSPVITRRSASVPGRAMCV